MPPLGMHLTLARQLAPQVGHNALSADPGAYYLGATTPDVRVMTRWERGRTHFFDLNSFDEQSGVARIREEYPELNCPDRLDESTTAFLCGYISHLEMDESWIVEVYRPCFGERSPLKGEVLANLLDRVLQFELDRRGREDPAVLEEIRSELLATACAITTRLIDRETLVRWREVSADILSHPPTWDRFGRIASRHLRAYGVESEEDVAHFLRNVPDMLDQSLREVTPERLAAFQERSQRRALDSMREYLA